MYKPITSSNRLEKEDILTYRSYGNNKNALNASVKYNSEIIESDSLEVFKGPEFNKLSVVIQKQLLKTDFSLSKLNSRMAYQLEQNIENSLEQILTSPVLPGTVQLTPAGNLIILMRDCQTTGGYPRILHLTEKAINRLSQKTTGNTIKFRLKE